jgi:hypothetical protein
MAANVPVGNKTLVSVSFASGIDTKADPKQPLQPSNLLSLTNGILTQTGLVSRRWGYTSLSTSILGGTNIAAGVGLANYANDSGGNELVAFDGSSTYSYIPGESQWSARGTVIPVTITDQTIIQNSYQQLSPDHARVAGIDVYAWEDSRNGVRYAVFDVATGAAIVVDASVTTTAGAGRPKCVPVSATTVGIFIDDGAGNIRLFKVASTSPTTLSAIGVIISGLVSPFYYDVAVAPSSFGYIAYWKLNVNQTVVVEGFAAGFVSGPTFTNTVKTLTIAAVQKGQIGLTTDSSNNVWVMCVGSNATNVTIAVYSTTGTSVLAPTNGIAVAGTTFTLVVGALVSGVLNYFLGAVAGTANTVTSNSTISLGFMTVGGVSTGNGTLNGLNGIAAKPFVQGGALYLWVAYQTNLQSCYILYQMFTTFTTIVMVARTLYGLGAGWLSNVDYMVPECQNITGSQWMFANGIKGTPNTEAGVILSLLGVNATTVNFANVAPIQTVSINDSLYIAGGLTQRYDGQHVVEAGFMVYPEIISGTPAATGGLMAQGTYQYVATYEWVDSQGDNEVSAPSPPITVTTAAGATNSVALVAFNANQTNKVGVKTVWYRTTNAGTVFYRVSSAILPVYNSPPNSGTQTTTFTDTLADASITANGALYTQPLSIGQNPILPNFCPPASKIITTYAQRVWLAGLDDPYTIWYSQTAILGSPMQFSPLLNLRVDPDGGKITALARMDGNLFIFKAYAIFFITGQGPTATGDQNDIGAPTFVPSGGVGCSSPQSIVFTPLGLLFQATNGQIYLLDRSLNVTWTGAPMTAFAAGTTVTTATLIPDQWVVFTLSNGTAIVYDYYYNQWSTFTNHAAVGACLFAGAAGNPYCWIDASGVVHQQTTNAYLDGSTPIPFSLQTAWLNPEVLQGFVRIYHLFLLGQYISPHTLNVQVAYDYDNTDPVVQASIPVVASFGLPTYQYRLDLLKKCTALQVTISDNGTSVSGAGFSLSALGLVIGTKAGGNKLAAAKQFGVQ